MHDRIDPQLAAGLQQIAALFGSAGELDLGNIPALRAQGAEMLAKRKALMPAFPGISIDNRRIAGPEGAPEVSIRIYRPDNAGPLPVLLWMHGGGYIIGSIEQDDPHMSQLALGARCAVVSVDYRLAPEHPFPAPLEDCYAVLQWIHRHAEAENFDRARIAVGGGSAGGGLAAGLALLARDRAEVPVCFQWLIYPMIDDRNVRHPGDGHPEGVLWTHKTNEVGWRSYLGQEPGAADVPGYAAATRATNLRGLPPAYIAVGELDIFLMENIDYAARLTKAGVATELHVYPGAYHGFDSLVPAAELAQRFVADRNTALARAFTNQ